MALYPQSIHKYCPLKGTQDATDFGQGHRCLDELGCEGEDTKGLCTTVLFNGGVNYCMGAGAPCFGCTEPDFGKESFFDKE